MLGRQFSSVGVWAIRHMARKQQPWMFLCCRSSSVSLCTFLSVSTFTICKKQNAKKKNFFKLMFLCFHLWIKYGFVRFSNDCILDFLFFLNWIYQILLDADSEWHIQHLMSRKKKKYVSVIILSVITSVFKKLCMNFQSLKLQRVKEMQYFQKIRSLLVFCDCRRLKENALAYWLMFAWRCVYRTNNDNSSKSICGKAMIKMR